MNKKTLLLLLAIFLLGAFLRFYEITEFPLGLYPDEAMNGNNALETLATGKPKIFYPENNGREGLFILLQAGSIALFGNEPWTLRVVSALIGTLTILGVFLAARELFKPAANPIQDTRYKIQDTISAPDRELLSAMEQEKTAHATYIALLSAFFIAASYWHLNFSRIGFRAIMVPLLASFGIYFLLKGLREKRIFALVLAGLFTGLGFYTYIAWRFMPFVLVIPLLFYLFPRGRRARITPQKKSLTRPCTVCAVTLFLFITFVTTLPIGLHFFKHPEQFAGRSPADNAITVWSAESPLYEFGKADLQTLGMFFVKGDCNWRHNYMCKPELYWPVAIFFALGLGLVLARMVRKRASLTEWLVAGWCVLMLLPATLTREGLPHALRTIGAIPPVMILAGFGAWRFLDGVISRFEKWRMYLPHESIRLGRIEKEIAFLFVLALLFIPIHTYRTYFLKWAQHTATYDAFATDYLHMGQYLRGLPPTVEKYVIVNVSGVDVRGIPSSAQTVMYITNTFTEEERRKKRVTYLLPAEARVISLPADKRIAIAFLNGFDHELINTLKQTHPELKSKAPLDFVVLQNY